MLANSNHIVEYVLGEIVPNELVEKDALNLARLDLLKYFIISDQFLHQLCLIAKLNEFSSCIDHSVIFLTHRVSWQFK